MLGLQLILGNVACMLLADYRWRSLEGVIHLVLGREAARLFAQKGSRPSLGTFWSCATQFQINSNIYLISLFFPRLQTRSRDPLSNPANVPLPHLPSPTSYLPLYHS